MIETAIQTHSLSAYLATLLDTKSSASHASREITLLRNGKMANLYLFAAMKVTF